MKVLVRFYVYVIVPNCVCVLSGYLEGEQCEQAAKCFLDTSQHLSEYRQMAQRGKRYPTKVNGYSLKEVLEEYCLVHSIGECKAMDIHYTVFSLWSLLTSVITQWDMEKISIMELLLLLSFEGQIIIDSIMYYLSTVNEVS